MMYKAVYHPRSATGGWYDATLAGQPFYAEKGIMELLVERAKQLRKDLEFMIIEAPEAETMRKQGEQFFYSGFGR